MNGAELYWRQVARRVAWKLNAGLWLEGLLPLSAASALVLSALLLWTRTRSGGEGDPRFWLLPVVAFAVGGIFQGFRVRRALYRREDALVWLDDRLGLRNRLSAAVAGVGTWPPRPSSLPKILRWRGAKLAPPAAFSAAVLALAANVPVPPVETPTHVAGEPLSWTEMERAIESLREEEVVDEEALEAFEERLDSLRQKPRDEWFSHGSLEASDSLKEELRSEMRALAEGLAQVEAELSEMEALGESAPREERRLRGAKLRESINDIDLGRALPLNRKLSRQLETLAREREVRQLTDEELERIRNAKERLYHGLRTGKEELVVAGLFEGEGGLDSGRYGSRPGKGGVTRGPGTAPIELSDERTELGTTAIEAVRNEDLRRAGFGDTVSVRIKEHDVDVSDYTGAYDAGTVASFGEGGDLIWSQSLSPEERRVLRQYFK